MEAWEHGHGMMSVASRCDVRIRFDGGSADLRLRLLKGGAPVRLRSVLLSQRVSLAIPSVCAAWEALPPPARISPAAPSTRFAGGSGPARASCLWPP